MTNPLTSTGSGSMTHKVAVASPDEVDDELVAWLRHACDASGR